MNTDQTNPTAQDAPGATISERRDPQHLTNPDSPLTGDPGQTQTLLGIDYGSSESVTAYVDPLTLLTLGRSVSINMAAQLKGWSRRTVYSRIADGTLQTIRTPNGGSQRVLVASLVVAPKRKIRPRGKRGPYAPR